MAEKGTWESIRQHGLRSTIALLDLYDVRGTERAAILCQHRPEFVEVRHAALGAARIRDQKPIPPDKLSRCLDDVTTTAWYKLLNGKVFFWLTEERLQTFLCARSYRDDEHIVITVETAELVSRYQDAITLSPINSGAAAPAMARRGSETFRRLDDCPYEEWRRARAKSAVAELAVDYAIPDIASMTSSVERRSCETRLGPV